MDTSQRDWIPKAPVERLLATTNPDSTQVKAWKSYPKDHQH